MVQSKQDHFDYREANSDSGLNILSKRVIDTAGSVLLFSSESTFKGANIFKPVYQIKKTLSLYCFDLSLTTCIVHIIHLFLLYVVG